MKAFYTTVPVVLGEGLLGGALAVHRQTALVNAVLLYQQVANGLGTLTGQTLVNLSRARATVGITGDRGFRVGILLQVVGHGLHVHLLARRDGRTADGEGHVAADALHGLGGRAVRLHIDRVHRGGRLALRLLALHVDHLVQFLLAVVHFRIFRRDAGGALEARAELVRQAHGQVEVGVDAVVVTAVPAVGDAVGHQFHVEVQRLVDARAALQAQTAHEAAGVAERAVEAHAGDDAHVERAFVVTSNGRSW